MLAILTDKNCKNYCNKTGFELLFVIKETSLKQQISQFYLQILSSEKLAFRFVTGH